jgi:protein subunit release factor A
MIRIIEIRSAEGGADSQMFVADLSASFCALADRQG